MALDEDVRQEAILKVGISNYVGTATLAVIAGAVVLYTFILQNYRPRWYFYVVVVLALILLVFSFVLGGKGANDVAKAVGSGSWTAGRKTWQFDGQAVATLAGLVLVLIAAFIGNGSAEKSSDRPKPPDACSRSYERRESSHGYRRTDRPGSRRRPVHCSP